MLNPESITDSIIAGKELGDGFELNLSRKKIAGGLGSRLGASVGNSMEFQDFRMYQPGDDIRRIDWSAYARSDALMLRLYKQEIQPQIDILTDLSQSMATPTGDKALATIKLSALLLESACRSSVAASWWGFGNGWELLSSKVLLFPSHVAPVIGGTMGLADEFELKIPPFQKHGIRICISDFLWEESPESILSNLTKDAVSMVCINIVSPQELEPDFLGSTTLIDAELPETVSLKVTGNQIESYKKRLEDHHSLWSQSARKLGCNYMLLNTDDILSGNVEKLIDQEVLTVT